MSRSFATEIDDCKLQLKMDDASEYQSTGIERLLSDYDELLSLIPENNERMNRREEDFKEAGKNREGEGF
mgnify:CR=1 FL=1